jgi:hypothetical protein
MGKTLCRAFVWMFDPFRVGGGAKGIVEYGKILCRAFVWMFDPFRVGGRINVRLTHKLGNSHRNHFTRLRISCDPEGVKPH